MKKAVSVVLILTSIVSCKYQNKWSVPANYETSCPAPSGIDEILRKEGKNFYLFQLGRKNPFGTKTYFELKNIDKIRFVGRQELILEASIRDRNNGKHRAPSRKIRKLCPYDFPGNCDHSRNYRTMDGTCNNHKDPRRGASFTPFERLLPAFYRDGISEPNDKSLPSPREISLNVHTPSDTSTLLENISSVVMVFGQFLAHDIAQVVPQKESPGKDVDCCAAGKTNRIACEMPIPISSDDPDFAGHCMDFVRFSPTPDLNCRTGVRQALNGVTHFVDSSTIYGSSEAEANKLRARKGGLMVTSEDNLLPLDTKKENRCVQDPCNRTFCFLSGDLRVNENPLLLSMHTLWMREHNRVAARLAEINPQWRDDDELLYQEARKIVIAEIQHITYNEYLPVVLGAETMDRFALSPRAEKFCDPYDPDVRPMLAAGFVGAAFRFGHSMVDDAMKLIGGCPIKQEQLLRRLFDRAGVFFDKNIGMDTIVRGYMSSRAQKTDRCVTAELTKHLFERSAERGLDLVSLNIQRGRDLGLQPYFMYRLHCNLSEVRYFADLVDHSRDAVAALKCVYKSAREIELFPGGLSEKTLKGALVGPTFACLIAEQYSRLRKGDSHWYERGRDGGFTEGQLSAIRQATLARLVMDNTEGVAKAQPEIFRLPSGTNKPVKDSYLPSVNLENWKCDSCIR